MQKFIARQNISHFLRLLEREQDPEQRRLLNEMLAAERAKLDGEDASPDQPSREQDGAIDDVN